MSNELIREIRGVLETFSVGLKLSDRDFDSIQIHDFISDDKYHVLGIKVQKFIRYFVISFYIDIETNNLVLELPYTATTMKVVHALRAKYGYSIENLGKNMHYRFRLSTADDVYDSLILIDQLELFS